MQKFGFAVFFMLVLLFLSACSAERTPESLATKYMENTETEAVATEVTPTTAPDSAECMSCHTDKQRLIDTAAPVEEGGESESKGVG